MFSDTYPPALPYPSERGDSRWWSVGRHIMEHRKTRKTRIGWTEWIQLAGRQRPLLKGVPREWRGMYTAGGASTNIVTAYKDFWYLFFDTYPPASPYPSKRGDSRWRVVGCLLWMLCVDTSVTAAASPSERGATPVAGYVSRWRSQHKYHYYL